MTFTYIVSKIMKVGLTIALVLFSFTSWGSCTRTRISQTEDSRTALIPFGKINLPGTHLVPPGSHLATVVVPPTNYTYNGANGSSVLWECAAEDLDKIFFLVATNGDDRVGGYYDIGTPDGLSDVYATWFAYVGIRQTMSGVTLTRFWQKVPVTNYATTSSGRIQIRLQDIPPIVASLYRISSLPGTSAASSYCGNNNNDGSGIGFGSSTGRLYSCTQPNAYIQLSSSTSGVISFGHDQPGEDSATRYSFWGADNGFGYGMRTANMLYAIPSCVARAATPVVMFPSISVRDLEAGLSSTANFSVRVECQDNSVSGVATSQTALGFQVSEGAYSAARSLGMVNASGGVSTLVSDDYFADNMAKGVGISISYSDAPDAPITLIAPPGLATLTPGGNAAGWYPVMRGAMSAGASGAADHSYFDYSFIATLKKLDAVAVTAGKVHATAYVLVKVQ